ncbi:hypothetical protein L218DRAFT_1079541 [Marasmius fiardii PR-910]|nr:hypothetical protein L218DRAFT_1079541 [Marasmius fiardii PR-910]
MAQAKNWPLHLCLVLNFSSSVQALIEMRTIDDTFGDSTNPNITPIYNGNWIARTGPDCKNANGCTGSTVAIPNNTLIFNGTWHEAVYSPKSSEAHDDQASTLQLSFNGTGLSVFCILPPRTAIGTGNTTHIVCPLYLTFILDGQPVGSFNRTSEQLTDSFQYNISVFSRNNLENRAHTFMMLNNPTLDSFVLFDYASYVYDDEIEEVKHAVRAKLESKITEAGATFVVMAAVYLSIFLFLGAVRIGLVNWVLGLVLGPITLADNLLKRRRDLKRRIPNALEKTEYSFRYNSSAQPSYLKLLGDTRSHYVYGVLSDWAHKSLLKKDVPGVYWLQGSDSVWRSAIAQKLAKEEDGTELLATFFFSSTDSNRNNPQYLALAIAHEMLTRTSFGTRNSILQILQDTRDILGASVESQFETLVIGAFLNWRTKLCDAFRFPLRIMTASSTLIILDGLDECGSVKDQECALSLVVSAMEKRLPIRFLISSRPTDHLRNQFDEPDLRQHTKILSLDNDPHWQIKTPMQ